MHVTFPWAPYVSREVPISTLKYYFLEPKPNLQPRIECCISSPLAMVLRPVFSTINRRASLMLLRLQVSGCASVTRDSCQHAPRKLSEPVMTNFSPLSLLLLLPRRLVAAYLVANLSPIFSARFLFPSVVSTRHYRTSSARTLLPAPTVPQKPFTQCFTAYPSQLFESLKTS